MWVRCVHVWPCESYHTHLCTLFCLLISYHNILWSYGINSDDVACFTLAARLLPIMSPVAWGAQENARVASIFCSSTKHFTCWARKFFLGNSLALYKDRGLLKAGCGQYKSSWFEVDTGITC